MKKFAKVLLGTVCAVSMLSCAACGGGGGEKVPDGYTKVDDLNGKTAEQTYNDIMAVIESTKGNFTSTMTYDATCSVAGMDIAMAIKVIDKIDGANLYEYSYVDTGDMGVKQTLQVWYIEEALEDGSLKATAYAKKDNSQIMSANMTWAEICASLNLPSDRIFNPIYDFSGYSFSDVSFYVDEDSDDETDLLSYFTLFIKGEAAVEFVKTKMDFNVEGAKITASDIEYSFVLTDKGELDHIEIYCTVNMKYQGIAFEYVFDGDIVFSDIGTTVVTAPDVITVH